MGRSLNIPAAALVAALALALVGLTGCASAPDRAVSVAATYDLPYNLTDVLFSREMILHYRQSITMARLVPERSKDAFVKSLAEKIITEETAQIDVMAGSLKAWEFAVPDADNPPVHQMAGMLSPAQLLLLKGRSGPEFDRLWLTTLARHTDYGVRLAEKARDEGKDRATVELARKIAAEQKSQLAELIKHLS
ncbi:DUF305 domain-containing protein [Sphaerisporangium perillae]|uniref:DUF305 domain-containing protein n=1 Tax=Sphaerisporangium perillae TaxID=2935860 RepID=UPI00200BF77E|nr:DUF305 domain-containing protein [Sphaerisporangium perillae]